MARIFYYTATGNIYGVHPGAFSDTLPAGVGFIDVAEEPNLIVWPLTAAGNSGERFARVDAGALVAFEPFPPPEPRATGAQMIYEADARGQLDTLLAALTEPERAKLYARRRIVAGDDVAEALRTRLSVSAAAMASFIAAAAGRTEV